MPVSGVISGVRIHVASAATITTASEMPVFWTTESIVIRPWSVVWVGVPGVPVPHVLGSVWP